MDLATSAIATTNLLFLTNETTALRCRSVSIINFQFCHGALSPGEGDAGAAWYDFSGPCTIATVGFIFGGERMRTEYHVDKITYESHNPLTHSILPGSLDDSSSPEENVLFFSSASRENFAPLSFFLRALFYSLDSTSTIGDYVTNFT